jgi:hypothetical protein
MEHLGRGVSSHPGHEDLRRVPWHQMGHQKIDRDRGPERNKIKTKTTEQMTHADSLPEVFYGSAIHPYGKRYWQ